MGGAAPCDVRLSLVEVSRRFGPRRVFDAISAEVRQGEILVVTGPNGSGKSTLLRVVAGLLPPSSGAASIAIDGRDLDTVARRSAIGYVAPDLTLYAELSGAENLLFFAKMRGINLAREDLIELLHRVGLRGRGRDTVGSYSSGMRQRLKYAFALLHRPAILLLDEPSANLDEQGAEMVQDILAAHRSHGLAVIGTNELREVGWGDTVVRLEAAVPRK